jgi:hypothetical protein
MTIKVSPSPTADSRTCDVTKVTLDQLAVSSLHHIDDVRAGLEFFRECLKRKGRIHDYDKLTKLNHFFADFQTGFAQTGWWDNHRRIHRHHLQQADGIPNDVDLLDVLEWVVDCVMAGMARSGNVYDLQIPDGILQIALANTVRLLKDQIELVPLEKE